MNCWNLLRTFLYSRRRTASRSGMLGCLSQQLLLEPLEDRLSPTVTTSTGHGLDNNWSTAANWDVGVPRGGDTAVFNNNAARLLCVVDAVDTVSSLNLDWNGTITFNSTLTLTGISQWCHSTLNLSMGGLVNNGLIMMLESSGISLGAGILTDNNANATIELKSTAHLYFSGNVTGLFSLGENAIAKEPGSSYLKPWRCVSRLGL